MIIATIIIWAGFTLGLIGIGMLIALLVRRAPAGHEDRNGFHYDRTYDYRPPYEQEDEK